MSNVLDFLKVPPEPFAQKPQPPESRVLREGCPPSKPIAQKCKPPRAAEPDSLGDIIDYLEKRPAPTIPKTLGIEILSRILAVMVIAIVAFVALQ